MRALAQQCLRHPPQQLWRVLGCVGSPPGVTGSKFTPAARLANLCTTAAAQGPERSFPTEPRVGVGVVVLRRPPAPGLAPDLLLIKRAKEPNKGQWCFPGGSLELGETLAECAAREVAEETGIALQNLREVDLVEDEEGFSDELLVPTAFAAVDSIVMADGTTVTSGSAAGVLEGPAGAEQRTLPRFHYAIIEVAALVSPSHMHQPPQPLDDALDAMWLPTDRLRSLPNLVPMCARMTEEALRRFPIASQPLQPLQQTPLAVPGGHVSARITSTLSAPLPQHKSYGAAGGPPM